MAPKYTLKWIPKRTFLIPLERCWVPELSNKATRKSLADRVHIHQFHDGFRKRLLMRLWIDFSTTSIQFGILPNPREPCKTQCFLYIFILSSLVASSLASLMHFVVFGDRFPHRKHTGNQPDTNPKSRPRIFTSVF